MNFSEKVAAIAVIALALVASSCAPPDGSPEDIRDLPNKALTVKHDSFGSTSGLMVTLDYFDPSYRCGVLDNDAFARLNGRSVPLFRGEYYVIPPRGDDGGVGCTHPSVTLDQIPSDLLPPWTIEIGDASQIVAATFGPGTANPFDVGPLANAGLTSSFDTVVADIQRHPGGATPALATATFIASDGRSSVRTGEVGQSGLSFQRAIDPGWPAGPVTVQIDVYYYPADVLLDCQNATCSMTGLMGSCAAGPVSGFGAACTGLDIFSTRNVFSIQLGCGSVSGLCS